MAGTNRSADTLLTEEHRKLVGSELPSQRELVTRLDIRKYAIAANHTERRYLDGDEAPPLFYRALFWGICGQEELRPDGLPGDAVVPGLPLDRVMAGGVEVTFHRSIRPGDELIAHRRLTDLFEKRGRSGPLIFAETEVRLETASGELVLVERSTRIIH